MPGQQRFLTIAEAAEFLHVSPTSLRRWTKSGKLRSFRVGGRNERRFLMTDLLAFMPPARPAESAQRHRAEAGSTHPDNETYNGHICLFYHNADEQWQLLRPYLLEYLAALVPVLYIQDGAPPYLILELLKTEDLPLEDLIARGLLRVLPPAQTYLLGGSFDAQRMLSFMEAAIQGALEAGHQRILILGEMTWMLEVSLDAGQLKTYESQLNLLVGEYPAAQIICQYDLRRFDGPAVLEALITHPSIHLPQGRVPGFYGLEK